MSRSAVEERVAGAAVADSGDAAVRAALAAGRPDHAIDLLMDRQGDAIHRFCRAMLKAPDLTADVHQGVFIAAYHALRRGDDVDDFTAWLLGIARNRCLDALKARRRWLARFGFSTSAAREARSVAPSADDHIARTQRGVALLECLQALAPETRSAVVLRFEGDLSFEEMSRLCGDRAGTLQARVARALPGLRHCLEQKGWAGP